MVNEKKKTKVNIDEGSASHTLELGSLKKLSTGNNGNFWLPYPSAVARETKALTTLIRSILNWYICHFLSTGVTLIDIYHIELFNVMGSYLSFALRVHGMHLILHSSVKFLYPLKIKAALSRNELFVVNGLGSTKTSNPLAGEVRWSDYLNFLPVFVTHRSDQLRIVFFIDNLVLDRISVQVDFHMLHSVQ